MRLSNLIDAQQMQLHGEDVDICGLSADSREVEAGFLFAALPGTAADGAHFIPDALNRGAVALLVPEHAPVAVDGQIPVVRSGDPRRALALMAARFYPAQPEVMAAVTGTNGKTSVVSFLRQIWQHLGHQAASIGTVGVATSKSQDYLAHTTPDPVKLHQLLNQLAGDGVTHAALEVSSHGLQQRRADGVRLSAAAFTNISRDHLDYHASFEDYLAQKLRLFDELLRPGAVAMVNADVPERAQIAEIAKRRRLALYSVGERGGDLRLKRKQRTQNGHLMSVACGGMDYEIALPLVGDFQASNALVAAGLAIALGEAPASVLPALSGLRGAKGRLELVASLDCGAQVFVDYAHTPDALDNALGALRPYTENRLIVVFGCGGDRDPGKRPQMGLIACERADEVIVTDDNPRTEDAAKIRAEALAGCPQAREIGDRTEAIYAAMELARPGDVVLVAGKGHEPGQIIGREVIPFSDHDVVLDYIGQYGGTVQT